MPALYVALQAGIHCDSAMPRLSKKPRSHGVEPSPTPMTPTVGDSSTVTFKRSPKREVVNSSAVIHPAVPPPTTAMCCTAGSAERGAGGMWQTWLVR